MPVVVEFNIPDMSAQQYDRVVAELEASGFGAPDGRIYHVAAATEAGCFVVDVWESEEQFGRFGQTLMPLLQAAGVTPVPPEVRPVHHIM